MSRRSLERFNNDCLAIARLNAHSNSVVMAFLILPQKLEFVRIEEVGVGIERPEHAGNGALVDGLIGTERVGEILLDQAINFREALSALIDIVFGSGSRSDYQARSVQTSGKRAGNNNEGNEEKRTPSLGHQWDRPVLQYINAREVHSTLTQYRFRQIDIFINIGERKPAPEGGQIQNRVPPAGVSERPAAILACVHR